MRFKVSYRSDARPLLRTDDDSDVVVVGNGFHMVHKTQTSWPQGSEKSITVKFHPVSTGPCGTFIFFSKVSLF